ncbi:MAG: acylneuraminate cytidylyltransferase family protein [Bacteroidota bacterium]
MPQKNIKEVAGLPLIAYSIRAAQQFAAAHDAQIELSTEDEEIRRVAATYGLSTEYRRSDDLAGDRIGKVDVIRDLLEYAEKNAGHTYDYVLDLDVTAPLRTQEDLETAFEHFRIQTKALTLFSVNPAHRNPYFNMVEAVGDGLVTLSKRPDKAIFSRQQTPEVYDLNASFYFYRRAFFEEGHRGVILDHRSMVYVMPHPCFDVDTPLIFYF